MEKKRLNTPSLYISYYLKNNRIEYYDRMTEVRNKNNYEQWIKFFLRAIKESSEDAIETINKLSGLHDKNILIIEKMGKTSKNAKKMFDYLEKNPIIDIRKTADDLSLAYNTVSTIVKRFEENGILVKTNNANRNRVFSYEEYLHILRKDT